MRAKDNGEEMKYLIGSSRQDHWEETNTKTLMEAKRLCSQEFSPSVGGCIKVATKDGDRIDVVAYKIGFDMTWTEVNEMT
ncbi:hypothetical protein DRO61_05505 [Candidatus Bathyarchaeota archaeon]|nr:MAG: hypothetical protein DRO61_05505 [Candidatus Bathyarchaeota archaeon]